jgi:hypothetical protein
MQLTRQPTMLTVEQHRCVSKLKPCGEMLNPSANAQPGQTIGRREAATAGHRTECVLYTESTNCCASARTGMFDSCDSFVSKLNACSASIL